MSGALQAGDVFAGYRIDGVLGRGGMGVVYRAEDLRLGRTVALKILAPERAGEGAFRERFLRESRLLASIEHRNIVDVFHADETDGVLFLAMRFVDGFDLGALLRREGGRLEPPVVAHVIREAAEALDEAHSHGLVHRDVKPGNVLIAPRGRPLHEARVYLSDFGLTKRAGAESQLTTAGQFLGTPAYVAPEQIQGSAVDGRADLYALACVAYECLAGAPPYHDAGEAAMLMAHLVAPPPSLSAARPDLPAAVGAVIARGMAKSRDQRHDRCVDFALDLAAALPLDGSAPQVAATPAQPAKAAEPPATHEATDAPVEPDADRTLLVTPALPATPTTPPGDVTAPDAGQTVVGAGSPPAPPHAATAGQSPPAGRDAPAGPPAAAAAPAPPRDALPAAAPDGAAAEPVTPPPPGPAPITPTPAPSPGPAPITPTPAPPIAGWDSPTVGAGRGSSRRGVVLGAGGVAIALVAAAAIAFAGLGPGAAPTATPGGTTTAATPLGTPFAEATATADESRPYPDRDEAHLLNMVPSLVRVTCRRAEEPGPNPAPLARVECTPTGHLAPTAVHYTMYGSDSALDEAYAASLAVAQGVASLRNEIGRCTRPPHTGGYADYTHFATPGRVICYADPDGRALIVWSVKALRVMSEAARDDGNATQLYEWWSDPQRSGPLG